MKGEELIIQADVDKFENSIGFLKLSICNEKGELVANGTHTMYVAPNVLPKFLVK